MKLLNERKRNICPRKNNMDPRREFGNAGESRAAEFLAGIGYEVIEKQWRSKFGEIDLICLDGDEVVFVEVKTRASLASGYPEDSVTGKKLRHLELAGEAYLQQVAWEQRPYRFDVIAIYLDEITHLQGI